MIETKMRANSLGFQENAGLFIQILIILFQCEGSSAPCARCRRLKIDCIGFGEKRFKFQEENTRFVHPSQPQKLQRIAGTVSSASNESTPSNTTTPGKVGRIHTGDQLNPEWAVTLREGTPGSIAVISHNSLTRMVSKFTANLDSDQNSNYQLPWNFGPFLEDVPRRLGNNAALDAAAEALMTAYVAFRGRAGADPDRTHRTCTKSYGNAIKSLRECLNDHRASDSETLCSTMILLIVEVRTWIGLYNRSYTNSGLYSFLEYRRSPAGARRCSPMLVEQQAS